jgi:hypothetical protein
MAYKMVEVEIDLSWFDTDDLIEELDSRGRGQYTVTADETEMLTKAWLADREGRKDEAYALLREYMLEKLGKVV